MDDTFHNTITLVKVKPNEEHARILYEFLKQRKHKISHKRLPTYIEHMEFVISHPYRFWFIIKEHEGFIGTLYATKNNWLGVFVMQGKEDVIKPAITLFLKKIKPLKPIKSVRGELFSVNVPPSNKKLISILKSMGASLVQVTYLLNSFE
jgi:hypothetical protein